MRTRTASLRGRKDQPMSQGGGLFANVPRPAAGAAGDTAASAASQGLSQMSSWMSSVSDAGKQALNAVKDNQHVQTLQGTASKLAADARLLRSGGEASGIRGERTGREAERGGRERARGRGARVAAKRVIENMQTFVPIYLDVPYKPDHVTPCSRGTIWTGSATLSALRRLRVWDLSQLNRLRLQRP